MDSLKIPAECAQEMIAHALQEAPNECCGILTGAEGGVSRVHRSINIERSPVKYTIDPQDMLRIFQEADKAGLEVLGFYHSHTFTEAYPSPTDVNRASPWGYLYVIVSLADADQPVIRCFRIADRQVQGSRGGIASPSGG